jgi:hypothetical protein
MTTSQARIDSNRKNSAHSTGPTSATGKQASRKNSLKHGLTGEGIVVADVDASEVERRNEEFQADLAPQTAVGKFLVRQMATLSVRIDRAAEQETSAIATRVRHAVDVFDQERLDEADKLLDLLGEDPRPLLRKLRKSPEGVERLSEAWQNLRNDLTREPKSIWTAWHRERAENLTGLRIDDARGSEIGVLSNAIWDAIGDSGLQDARENSQRQAQARGRMLARIDAEIAGLEAHYEKLDFATIELDRAEAPGRALFDSSKEATLARRYESEASRRFSKSMEQLREVEAEAAERPPVAATPHLSKPYIPLASSWDRPAPLPREPETMPFSGFPMDDEAEFEPIGKSGSREGRPPGSV